MAKNSRSSDSLPLLREVLKDGERTLLEKGISSPAAEAEYLLSNVLGMKRHELFLSFEKEIERGKAELFSYLIGKRSEGVPSQYLLNSCEFMGYDFEVGPGVLVPRPETEILVCEVVEEWKKLTPAGKTDAIILDIGTGSGAIAISLALILAGVKVIATEISPAALLFAERNRAKHGLSSERVRFCPGDLFQPIDEYKGRVWAVVSNPPYVKAHELETLPVEVRDYEPRIALDGGPDGLSTIRRIIDGSAEFLIQDGMLALEIPEDSAEKVVSMTRGAGRFAEVKVVKDLSGRDRILMARHGSGP
ncbi:MAG: peptide chain release factor N(5)-glutamine methyltransferase [Candidatus Eisenbacteria bacterium]|nr:peptide chain release factor N(5)-glutamine methyltransferase [Candidatus Eisenbacteria bacterium]